MSPTSSASGSSPLARGGLASGAGIPDLRGLIPAGAGRTRGIRWPGWPSWAHPRWRGADSSSPRSQGSSSGSSPLARGGQLSFARSCPAAGLIPAGAGRTIAAERGAARPGVHPRWRGADHDLDFDLMVSEGSSPLARGGRAVGGGGGGWGGLIPAGAGRTSLPPRRTTCTRAHPRWRGADSASSGRCRCRAGSSPLARGGPGEVDVRVVLVGLIPAGAGRTTAPSLSSRATRAHPRWRGADTGGRFSLTRASGSSPLARGGPSAMRRQEARDGLIPAGAGRTTSTTRSGAPSRAHPRWRGADLCSSALASRLSGSSPLARGGHVRDRQVRVGRRLIPAGAGRTGPRARLSCGSAAHPRWRGADHRRGALLPAKAGSSPLARGGHLSIGESVGLVGLIPAGAGRTHRGPSGCLCDRAHPRWRGADPPTCIRAGGGLGSSPLARGGRGGDERRSGDHGLIPAGAGRTRQGAPTRAREGAHPRWRGADLSAGVHART